MNFSCSILVSHDPRVTNMPSEGEGLQFEKSNLTQYIICRSPSIYVSYLETRHDSKLIGNWYGVVAKYYT